MASSVFSYRFDFYVSGAGGGTYGILRDLVLDGQHFYVRGPDSFAGGTIKIGVGSIIGPGNVEYEVEGFDFDPDTWYTLELKIIKTSGAYTVWVKPTLVDLAGPYPPSGADPSTATGLLGGVISVTHEAPDLGALRSPPLLLDDVQLARGDWVSEGGTVIFADDFETVPDPDSFVPPWSVESLTPGGGGGIFVDSGHTPDPTDAGNTVGALTHNGDEIGWGASFADIAPPRYTIKARF
jgi:hypothetical protein